ncbi:MAG: thrombospondin type 3 repeat-containing protein [Candidatus Zixiibacteriota bacterium]
MRKSKWFSMATLILLLALAPGADAERVRGVAVSIEKSFQAPQTLTMAGQDWVFQGQPTDPGLSQAMQGGEDIANATVISSLPYSATGTTVGYNHDYDVRCFNASTAPDVVYSYTPPANQRLDVVSCASSYHTKIFVYENDTLTSVGCSQFSDSCSPTLRGAIYDLPVYTGNTYYIVVDGYGGLSGNYDLQVILRPVLDTVMSHPALADNNQGLLVLGHENMITTQRVYWQSSLDDGFTWSDAVYWNFGGAAKYPSVDYFGMDTSFYGTVVPPVEYFNGAPTFLINMVNGGDPNTFQGSYWDWSQYGWHDMQCVDIACDDSQESWRWGIMSFVHSTTYTTPDMVDAPHLTWQTSAAGQATISWYSGIDGCSTTTCDIDPTAAKTYAVYDWFDASDGIWKLFARQDNFANMADTIFGGGFVFITEDSTDIQFPAVAANNSAVLVIAENYTETTPDDKDLICWRTVDGNMANLTTEVVVATTDAERFPRIQSIAGQTFLVTFVRNGALYATITEDAGTTWSTPTQVSLTGDSVISDYRSVDIAESDGYFAKIIYEYHAPGVKGPNNRALRIIDYEVYPYPDADADGVPDFSDNCPAVANAGQEDVDSDGHGDACDNCVNQSNVSQTDTDSDSFGDACDNCPALANVDQADNDADGVGNVCDNCPDVPNPLQEDSNSNGVGDACDYICGDANGSGGINILDATFIIAYLFKGGATPDPLISADANNNGSINILDATFLINFLFKGGAEPSC